MVSQRDAKGGSRIGGTCRLCLGHRVGLTEIFSKGEASERLCFRILDCCPVTLFEDSRLPNAICEECEKKVTATFEFREQCRQSERSLRSTYGSSYPAERARSLRTHERDCSGETECGQILEERKESERTDGEIAGEGETGSSKEAREREKPERNWKMGGDRADGLESEEIRAVEGSPDGEQGGTGGREIGNHEAGHARRYLCEVCSKTFASKTGLRFHLKAHNGAKPHSCRHCGKAFAIASYAKRHERIHAGDKRFVCQFCSAAFASSNGLKYHLRLHTGEANYPCGTCGKSFRRYKYLKEHAFTHTGEKPFACKSCSSAYGNSGSLFVHEKKCKARFSRDTRVDFGG